MQENLIAESNVEMKMALEGYDDFEISNLDESRIMINQIGVYSFQPMEGQVPARKVAALNEKAGLTIMTPIKKNGQLDFKPIIVDSHIPSGMEKGLDDVLTLLNWYSCRLARHQFRSRLTWVFMRRCKAHLNDGLTIVETEIKLAESRKCTK